MEKSAETLRDLGLEPLTEWRADRGAYERWLASEGVRVVFLYDPPESEKLAKLRGEIRFYNPSYDRPWVPPWVNALGKSLRGQRLVDGVRAAVRDDPLAEAVAGAYALGGQRAVEELILGVGQRSE